MSNRLASTRHAGAVLERILDQPALVSAVRELEPKVLHALIRHVGLEDCGELVALATREQIAEVFDEDLWRAEAVGKDARFDPNRFALWLQVLVEQGAALAAEKVSEIDEDLLTLALSKLIFVIDIDALAVRMSNRGEDSDAEQLEKQLESTLHHEFENYRVIARDARAFESIMTVLLELDTRDYHTLARLLDRCCRISTDYIEDNGGLYQVLSAGETAEEDVSAAREERRERAGFLAPSSAVAFLKLAKETPLAELVSSRERDPITKAHFRHFDRSVQAPAVRSSDHDGLLRLLQEAKVVPRTPHARQLPSSGSGSRLRRALASLLDGEPALHSERMFELAYLANVLLAANGMRPVEAAQRALELCERGASYLLGVPERPEPVATEVERARDLLQQTDLVKLFRVGFHLQLRES